MLVKSFVGIDAVRAVLVHTARGTIMTCGGGSTRTTSICVADNFQTTIDLFGALVLKNARSASVAPAQVRSR